MQMWVSGAASAVPQSDMWQLKLKYGWFQMRCAIRGAKYTPNFKDLV